MAEDQIATAIVGVLIWVLGLRSLSSVLLKTTIVTLLVVLLLALGRYGMQERQATPEDQTSWQAVFQEYSTVRPILSEFPWVLVPTRARYPNDVDSKSCNYLGIIVGQNLYGRDSRNNSVEETLSLMDESGALEITKLLVSELYQQPYPADIVATLVAAICMGEGHEALAQLWSD